MVAQGEALWTSAPLSTVFEDLIVGRSRIDIIIIIITSNDDPKPSTVISDQSPSG